MSSHFIESLYYSTSQYLPKVPYGNRGRKGGRRRSRSQAPALATSSSSEESVSNASVASVASARELRLPDLEMQVDY